MHELKEKEDWEDAKEASKTRPVIIYKHSNNCGSCTRMDKTLKVVLGEADISSVYRVTVQEARTVSNIIERELGVIHETPQVIIIRGGEAFYYASHHEIDALDIVTRYREIEKIENLDEF